MKFVLYILILFNLSKAYSFNNSQYDTSDTQSFDVNPVLSEVQTSELHLVDSLLSGVDFAILNAVISNSNLDARNNSFYVSLHLVAHNSFGDKTYIELFRSDEFSGDLGHVNLNKEVHIPGYEIFKILDPHITSIETARKINLAVSLIKLNRGIDHPIRNLGQNNSSNFPNIIYSFEFESGPNNSGFRQDIHLPEAFSFADNSEITDLGFSLYFR